MHHFFSIAFSLLAIIGQHVSSARGFRSLLTVPNGGPWGTWRDISMCPHGTYAYGFSVRVEAPGGDDTALNGIHLFCTDRSEEDSSTNDISPIESHIGYWGEWKAVKNCPKGLLKEFQLRVESVQLGDDTAANNIRFECSDGTLLEGDGTTWGDWGGWSSTCEGTGICGISTKIEEPQGDGDDTALNDVRMYCCD